MLVLNQSSSLKKREKKEKKNLQWNEYVFGR